MSDLNLTNTLTAGTPEDVGDVQENFVDIVTWANGNIDGDNLTAATNQALALNETGTVRRGKSIIATEESRTNVAYGTLTTPDRVSNIVLPTDGLLYIAFQAMWKESSSGAAKAAIFIGSDQLKIATAAAAPAVQETGLGVTANNYIPLASAGLGLAIPSSFSAAYTGHVTTGQVVGVNDTGRNGWVTVFAAAGTYTISIQFKASTGSVTAKERKLWVKAEAFG